METIGLVALGLAPSTSWSADPSPASGTMTSGARVTAGRTYGIAADAQPPPKAAPGDTLPVQHWPHARVSAPRRLPAGSSGHWVEGSSLGPDVYLEEISHTLRMTEFRSVTVSRTDPDVAYVSTFTGFVFKTEDGGKTWDESRLILERRGFLGDEGQPLHFGSQRGSTDAWGVMHMTGSSIDAFFRNPGGGRTITRPDAVGFSGIDLSGGGRVSEESNRNVGIGLPGRAPRLQAAVRKFGKVTAGLNIKQTLLLRGAVKGQMRIIVIHPHNPRIAYACTFFGMYRTTDGGLTWVRVFVGDGPRSSMVFSLAVDPEDGKTVLLASGDGMFISTDGGRNFMKHPSQGVGNGTINWILFNPYDSRYVLTATDYGMLRSSDRGRNWEWVYFTTFPTARVVRYVHIDPHDKKTGYIGTHDGPFTTPNILTAGLEDWKRVGGLRFTGTETIKIDVDPTRKGHMWVMSNMKLPLPLKTKDWAPTGGAFVWESMDAGKNWRVIFSGYTRGRLGWYALDPRDPSMLWLIWTRSMARMRRFGPNQKPKISLPPKETQEIRELIRADKDPALTDVMMAIFRYAGNETAQVMNYRRGAMLKALVPRLDLSVAGVHATRHTQLIDAVYLPTLGYRQRESIETNIFEFRGMLTWDLSNLLFHLDATLFGRVSRLNLELRAVQLEFWGQRFYGELRQLKAMMIANPPKELYVRLHYLTRIEQLESYVDFMSGGYLTRYKKGDRPAGIDTPWFKRWPGTGPDIPKNQQADTF